MRNVLSVESCLSRSTTNHIDCFLIAGIYTMRNVRDDVLKVSLVLKICVVIVIEHLILCLCTQFPSYFQNSTHETLLISETKISTEKTTQKNIFRRLPSPNFLRRVLSTLSGSQAMCFRLCSLIFLKGVHVIFR